MKQISPIVIAAALIAAVAMAAEQDQQRPAKAPPAEPAMPPPAMFQPVAVDPALVRQSMQARAELDRMNRAINARKTKLYEDNAEIKALQEEMRALQGKIDAILAADEELKKLNAKQQEISPEMPIGARPFPMAPQNQSAPAPAAAPEKE